MTDPIASSGRKGAVAVTVAAVLILLLVAAAANGIGLGADPSRLTLARQFAYLPAAVLSFVLGRRFDLSSWSARQSRTWALTLPSVALVAIAVAFWLAVGSDGAISAVVYGGIAIVLPWAIGYAIRQQALLANAATERAEQIASTRAAFELLARDEVRQQVAADLHDRLGHDLALIALEAGRIEVSTDSTDRDAAAGIRQRALDATDRLRAYLASLSAADMQPVSVASAVAAAIDAGMTIDLVGDSRRPELVRAVVEALTNASRHAPGAPVRVVVDGERLTVTNALPETPRNGSPLSLHHTPPGRGLLSLRSRLAEIGLTVSAGPRNSSWVLTIGPAGGADND